MNSNIMEFIRTRKFWEPIVAFLMTLVVWGVPKLLSIEMTLEVQTIITAVLWGIASLVVWGDIRYDWINAENQNSAKG